MARPWLAGVYFGFLFSAVFTPFAALMWIRGGVWLAFALGVAIWLVGGLLFAIGLKRYKEKRFERPDVERHPAPTAWRIWSGASDRLLLWFMLIGAAATVAWTFGLISGRNKGWAAAVGLAFSIWLTATTWTERTRRRTSD